MIENIEEEAHSRVREERLSIEVTTHCNSACLHCFARIGNTRPFNLSLDLVKEIIAEGYDTGYRHLHITGGEPLLWKGLLAVLDCAFGTGYKTVFMNTNGTLLTKEVSGRLATYDSLSISVSLEGTEELHDHLRGVGSYRKAIRGIGKALNAGVQLLIFSVATKKLLPDLPHFAHRIYRLFPEIASLTLIPLIAAQNHVFLLSQLLNHRDYLELVRTVALLNLYGIKTEVLNGPLANVAAKLLEMPWIPRSHPLYCEGSMIIMADGNIGLSHSTRGSFGAYKPGMVRKVLSSDGYRAAIGPDQIACPSCRYLGLCRENGMIGPSEHDWNSEVGMPYCLAVLSRAGS